MRDPSHVRDEAARFYERALKPATAGGCCGASAASPIPIAAGYDMADLANLPADATGNSFGCGNPLAFAGVTAGQTVLDLGAGASSASLAVASER